MEVESWEAKDVHEAKQYWEGLLQVKSAMLLRMSLWRCYAVSGTAWRYDGMMV